MVNKTSKDIKVPIIPERISFYNTNKKKELDLKAIAIFLATGFFLDDDTYFKNEKSFKPGHIYRFTEDGDVEAKRYFNWHYSPRDISLGQAVDEFTELFERTVKKQIKDEKVVLPLSGGLDSRTLAAALNGTNEVFAFSYAFEDSFNETAYGREIAEKKNWPFQSFIIPKHYLWEKIDELSDINNCFSEFTHPRPMAIINELKGKGEVILLGHWGDVFFDDMGVPDDLAYDEMLKILGKKVIKKGGLELANAFWEAHNLEGTFLEYFIARVESLLNNITIENANARIRAFKSLYWAPKWTSASMAIFNMHQGMALPYYDDRMCKWICTVPEKHLAQRQIQIEYIKRRSPELAGIQWQEKRPYNLYNYQNHLSYKHLPYRSLDKLKRLYKANVLKKPLVTRNWENQFLGNDNERQLKTWLFKTEDLSTLMPADVINNFYTKFKEQDGVYYSHSISMLLTLAVWAKKFLKS